MGEKWKYIFCGRTEQGGSTGGRMIDNDRSHEG